MESNASVVVPEDIDSAPSDPFHPIGARISERVIFLFVKLVSLSEIRNSSKDVGFVFIVCQCTSTVGVTGIGIPFASNHTTCTVVPEKPSSTPV